MIKSLNLKNVGPAKNMDITFGERLNIITGDNGLGKSFLLDIIWYALSRRWPAEVNKKLNSGYMAQPLSGEKGTISFDLITDNNKKIEDYSCSFDRKKWSWIGKAGRPYNPGLVIYAHADGSFSVWDPAKNYWEKRDNVDIQERQPAYVFSPPEIWNGLEDDKGTRLCNGLIADWAGWQKEKGKEYQTLCNTLLHISPPGETPIRPGELTRISIDDARDIPTIKMPYGEDIPVLFASSGIRRILALSYALVWSLSEHAKASKLLAQDTSSRITFLIDEVEAHLHPKWQRQIISSLIDIMSNEPYQISKKSKLAQRSPVDVQIIAATHSPLIMASIEPLFELEKDAWFDLDINKEHAVEMSKRDFELKGDAENWLTSKAFDLKSTRSMESEKLIDEAAALLDVPSPDVKQIKEKYDKLCQKLSPKDDFLFRWRSICEKKGYLK